MDAVPRFQPTLAFFGEHEAGGWTYHGVAHSHHIDVAHALPDVGVGAREIIKDGFLPVVPIFREQQLAGVAGRVFG